MSLLTAAIVTRRNGTAFVNRRRRDDLNADLEVVVGNHTVSRGVCAGRGGRRVADTILSTVSRDREEHVFVVLRRRIVNWCDEDDAVRVAGREHYAARASSRSISNDSSTRSR